MAPGQAGKKNRCKNQHCVNQRCYAVNAKNGSRTIEFQHSIYIDGIGTEAGKPDRMIGQMFGTSDTGVIAKTDKAVAILRVLWHLPDHESVVTSLRFDLFDFSRGAAAARHFTNRIQAEDPAIIRAIRAGMEGTAFRGESALSACLTPWPANGFNPHRGGKPSAAAGRGAEGMPRMSAGLTSRSTASGRRGRKYSMP